MTEQLQVMSYNVKNAYDLPPHSWRERKKLVRDLLVQEAPDIIGTQECLHKQVRDLLTMLPEYHLVGLGREGGRKGEYAAIFYKKDRFNVSESGHFWLSATPEVVGSATWGNVITRIVTWAKFVDIKTDQSFYHFNTHFDHQSSEARVKSAELLLERTKDLELPIILTGDFNAEYQSLPYSVLVRDGAFADTWYMTESRFNEKKGTFNNYRDTEGGADRIDWILVRGNLKVESTGVVADCPKGRFPSDHFPIVAHLSF